MKLKKKQNLLQKRRWRIRKNINGTAERPRLSVRFTNKHIYAQCIDDEAGKTVVFATSTAKETKDQGLKANVEGAVTLGTLLGEKAKSAGFKELVFDRNGRRYHGSVKAFADAVRATGLAF